MTRPKPDTRDDLFEVARFVATRRGPEAHKAMRAAADAMCAFERLTFDLEMARDEIAGLRWILDRKTNLAERLSTAAGFYASAFHHLTREYRDLAAEAGVVVRERPPC